MRIWPAIDISHGKCVRLRQGDFAQETVFADDPGQVAAQFAGQGATCLHVVDLDGARQGEPGNVTAVRHIRKAFSGELQVGGGLRTLGAVAELLSSGVDRVVVGTLAITSPDVVAEICHKFPRQIALGLDSRDGLIAVRGWQEVSSVRWEDLLQRLGAMPFAALIVTDIATDGMLVGPNLRVIQDVVSLSPVPVIASGGVSSLDDLAALASTGVEGAIVGRAIYEGRVNLAEVIQMFEVNAIR